MKMNYVAPELEVMVEKGFEGSNTNDPTIEGGGAFPF